ASEHKSDSKRGELAEGFRKGSPARSPKNFNLADLLQIESHNRDGLSLEPESSIRIRERHPYPWQWTDDAPLPAIPCSADPRAPPALPPHRWSISPRRIRRPTQGRRKY